MLLVSCSATLFAQGLIIPHVVDGGAWQTTIVLTNTAASVSHAGLNFLMETSGNQTQPWNLTFLEGTATQSIILAAGATMFLHTPGTGATTSQGWGQLIADPGVVAYAIFTSRFSGFSAQQGTAPAGTSAPGLLIPFDNTSGLLAAIALVNTSAAPETISVAFRTTGGTITQGTLNVPANGHVAFVLQQQFPTTAGQSGLAEFYTNNGTISAIALSYNVSGGAFSSAPVYFETGPPIISTGSGSTLSLQGATFALVGSMVISGKTLTVNMQVIPNGNQYFVSFNDSPSFASGVDIVLGMNTPLSVSGSTATFKSPSALNILTSDYSDITNPSQPVIGNITAATITVTFTSLTAGSPLTGTVTFTVSGLTTSSATVQGNFSGTLTQIAQLN